MGNTISNLNPAPYNPRKITDKKLAMLQKSMAEFGDLSGIVVNVRTGNLVGGHQRAKAFDPSWPISKEPHADVQGTVALGFVETPWGRWVYREVDWDETKEKAANIAANKHGGDWDFHLLSELIVELDTGDLDMGLTGFDNVELERLLSWTPGDDRSKMRKNFNDGCGAYDISGVADSSAQADRYPVTVVLDADEYERWQAAKERLGVKDDKKALLKLIGGN